MKVFQGAQLVLVDPRWMFEVVRNDALLVPAACRFAGSAFFFGVLLVAIVSSQGNRSIDCFLF